MCVFVTVSGLYGLTPLLADVRGIFTRYNFINDLANILDAPLENFINANYVPLPQVRQAGFEHETWPIG